MDTRRDFLKKSALSLGATSLGGAALGAGGEKQFSPSSSSSLPKKNRQIVWRLQTYATAALAEFVIKPSIDIFNKVAKGQMKIELYTADEIVSTDELFEALKRGEIDAIQSDDDSLNTGVPISVFTGYFPFAFKSAQDVSVLFNEWGLQDIWAEAYGRVNGVNWLGAGAWDPFHLITTKPIHGLDDFRGLRLHTFPTAGKFLSRFGVIREDIKADDVKIALKAQDIHGIACSGITEAYTLGWADIANYFLTNSISGAWCGSYFANSKSWDSLPSHLQELFKLCMTFSHYRRQHWYHAEETRLRAYGKKLQLTTIPDYEWKLIESEGYLFWKEIAKIDPLNAKVIKIFEKYRETVKKAEQT
ncbi:MAG: hypothetical protein OXB88_08940 [Bacteriovoracales bacterium]|nr:hypothetical protein [Bacteriovoracales bacterium]